MTRTLERHERNKHFGFDALHGEVSKCTFGLREYQYLQSLSVLLGACLAMFILLPRRFFAIRETSLC